MFLFHDRRIDCVQIHMDRRIPFLEKKKRWNCGSFDLELCPTSYLETVATLKPKRRQCICASDDFQKSEIKGATAYVLYGIMRNHTSCVMIMHKRQLVREATNNLSQLDKLLFSCCKWLMRLIRVGAVTNFSGRCERHENGTLMLHAYPDSGKVMSRGGQGFYNRRHAE